MGTWWIPLLGVSVGVALAVAIPDPVPQAPAPAAAAETVAVGDPALVGVPAAFTAAANLPRTACDAGDADPLDVIRTVAEELAAQRIYYRSQALSDCSGMAHRVLDALQARCEGVDAPSAEAARSSRDLAHWYADASLLVPVGGVDDLDRWLTPGAVVFYARGGHLPDGLDAVLDRVVHVGVVVDVERDEAGQVQRYALFHGRNPGLPASITRWHLRSNSPALGNGPEQVVALAFAHAELAQAAPILAERNGTAAQDALADDFTAEDLVRDALLDDAR